MNREKEDLELKESDRAFLKNDIEVILPLEEINGRLLLIYFIFECTFYSK